MVKRVLVRSGTLSSTDSEQYWKVLLLIIGKEPCYIGLGLILWLYLFIFWKHFERILSVPQSLQKTFDLLFAFRGAHRHNNFCGL